MNQTTVSVTKCLCVVYAFWKWLQNEHGSTKSRGSQYEATNVSFHLIFSKTWNDQGHFHHRPWGSARQANRRMAWHRQRLELKIVSSSFQFYQAPLGSLNGLGCTGSESLVASQQETMLWIWGFPILTSSHIFPGTESTIQAGWEVPFSSEAQQCQHSLRQHSLKMLRLNRVSLWIKTLRWTPKPEPQNAIGCRELLSAWVINDY